VKIADSIIEGEFVRIEGIKELEFDDRAFVWRGVSYAYDRVKALEFTATITQNRVNGIPTGKTYTARLKVHTASETLAIVPRTGWFGQLNERAFQALQHAHTVFATTTFTARVERYERQVEQRGFFEFGDFQFHQDGHVFRDGREIGGLRGGELKLALSPFAMTIQTPKAGMGARLKAAWSGPLQVDLTTDRDCFLYLMKSLYGMTFVGVEIPKKTIDRRRLFLGTVVRFGAILAAADGHASPAELVELRRFFQFDQDSLPEAGQLFNEELANKSTVAEVLGAFAETFAEAPELKEGFLLGMLSVALADGRLHSAERAMILSAGRFLSIQPSALARIFAAAGIQIEGESRNDGARGTKSNGADAERLRRLRILGLNGEAGPEMILKAYRALVRRYHPDILRGQGMPEHEIARASAIITQVNLAYEWLSERGV
jgi:DnaJ like chaperone protein